MTSTDTPAEILDLVERGALFIVNHSGGKDSQAMFAHLAKFVPAAQLVVVHAHLAGIEWQGTIEHIYKTVGETPVHVTEAVTDWWAMAIEREIRAICKARGNGLVVNCMGIRAEESSIRAKAQAFKLSARNSKAGREWYEWLPIHEWNTAEVFAEIAAAGQAPHWA